MRPLRIDGHSHGPGPHPGGHHARENCAGCRRVAALAPEAAARDLGRRIRSRGPNSTTSQRAAAGDGW